PIPIRPATTVITHPPGAKSCPPSTPRAMKIPRITHSTAPSPTPPEERVWTFLQAGQRGTLSVLVCQWTFVPTVVTLPYSFTSVSALSAVFPFLQNQQVPKSSALSAFLLTISAFF